MKIRGLLSAMLLASWLACPARATTLVQLSLEQLSRASSHIVRGRVVSQESRWNEAHTQIVTVTTFAVDYAVKGKRPATVLIEQPGGTVGNIHVRVAGTVRFYPQESYLLFLEPARASDSRFLLVGMVQGAYRIYRDVTTNEERVINPLGGLYYGPQERAGGVRASAQTVSLREFRQQLSTALQAPTVIPRGTTIPLTVLSTETRGVGRVRVLGRTAMELYPSASVVIPAGSPVEGTAELVAGKWRIRWTEISIRGTRVPFSANSEEPAGGTLRGRMLVVKVR